MHYNNRILCFPVRKKAKPLACFLHTLKEQGQKLEEYAGQHVRSKFYQFSQEFIKIGGNNELCNTRVFVLANMDKWGEKKIIEMWIVYKDEMWIVYKETQYSVSVEGLKNSDKWQP